MSCRPVYNTTLSPPLLVEVLEPMPDVCGTAPELLGYLCNRQVPFVYAERRQATIAENWGHATALYTAPLCHLRWCFCTGLYNEL